MSERNPELPPNPEIPRRDRDAIKRELGRIAIEGKQRSDVQRAQHLGQVAVDRARKSDPPREERSR